MGIRFCCPNGHPLHVKAFLAGKRGICPRCGVAVDIPAESEPDQPGEEPSVVLGPPDDPIRPAAPAPPPGVRPASREQSRQPPYALPSDPIAAAPDALWYVRLAGGGQFGPAPGQVLANWISEGRLGGEHLIWRDDWPDWRLAGEWFPSLPISTAAPLAPQASATLGAPSKTAPSRSETVGRRRRRSRDLALLAVVLLALASLALLGVLIYVLAGRA